MATAKPSELSVPAHDSLALLFTGLTWYFFCPGALCLIALGIAVDGRAGLQGLDLLYWAVAPLAAAVRYLEIHFLARQISAEAAESMLAWRRYGVRLMASAAGLWLLAHGVAYLTGR